MHTLEIAEEVRAACIRTVTAAYEDAGLRGLCGDGRWEAAVGSLRSLDLTHLVEELELPAESLSRRVGANARRSRPG